YSTRLICPCSLLLMPEWKSSASASSRCTKGAEPKVATMASKEPAWLKNSLTDATSVMSIAGEELREAETTSSPWSVKALTVAWPTVPLAPTTSTRMFEAPYVKPLTLVGCHANTLGLCCLEKFSTGACELATRKTSSEKSLAKESA